MQTDRSERKPGIFTAETVANFTGRIQGAMSIVSGIRLSVNQARAASVADAIASREDHERFQQVLAEAEVALVRAIQIAQAARQ